MKGIWLKPEKVLGHVVFFRRLDGHYVRYYIDSKKNYSGDGLGKKDAKTSAANAIMMSGDYDVSLLKRKLRKVS